MRRYFEFNFTVYDDSILTPVAGKEPTATIPVQFNYGTAEPNKENYLKKDLIIEILHLVAIATTTKIKHPQIRVRIRSHV